MKLIKSLFKKYNTIIKYGLYSVLVMIIDIFVVYILKNKFNINIVSANTAGVITGAVVQYFFVTENVFKKNLNFKTLIVFFSTFALGLFLADLTIYISYNSLLKEVTEQWAFLLSKGFSIVIPFFIMYFIRKYAYDKI